MEKLMPLADLRAGYDSLHRELENEPSKYAYVAEVAANDINDSLPEHSAPPAIEEAAE